MALRQLIRDNRLFLILWGLFLMAGIVWMGIKTKGDGVLFLNQFYTHQRNEIFLFITRLGEQTGFFILLTILLIFKEVRFAVGLVLLSLIVLGVTFSLKNYVFPDAERPISFLGEDGLNLVKNMRVNRDHSFPSGHTTAGFAFFSYMAFAFRQNSIKIISLCMAALVAISRVYLVQHFVQDVVAGSVIGVLLAIFCFHYIAEAPWTKKIRFFNIGLLK